MNSATKERWQTIHFNGIRDPAEALPPPPDWKERLPDDWAETHRVLHANDHGFGDALTTAWLSEATKHDQHPLVHFATGSKAELLELFGQLVVYEPQPGMLSWGNPYMQEVRSKGALPRLDFLRRAWGVTQKPVRPTLEPLPDAIEEWAGDRVQDNTVLVFPQTAQAMRRWPVAYWYDLCDLLKKRGFHPILLLGAIEPGFEVQAESYAGLAWTYYCAMLKRCAMAVGNDSAPAHLAGTLDVPTLALMGPTTSSCVFGHVPSVTGISVTRGQTECVGCFYQSPYRAACRVACQALMMLSPKVVMQRIEQCVKPRSRTTSA
jgi:hypothetical protein